MNKLSEVIENSGGKMLTVVFIKADGTERVLNGRVGVSKYVKGTGKVMSDKYLTIYDVKNKGYRSVNKDTIIEVRANKQIIK